MQSSPQEEQRLALFIDFENIAIGVRDAHYRKFDINLVLERLLDKGKLLVKKAYADWSRYSDYKRSFHEAAIELIEVPQKSVGGKNSADIRLVVDAMDMSFQKEHINCFVVASGDSDFSPLVSKLKENNKYVIGLGVKNSTSDLLIENCDEFIFYEDLVRGQQRPMPRCNLLVRLVLLLAELDRAVRDRMLISVDHFIRSTSATMLSRRERRALLDRFGIFGVRLAAALVRGGVRTSSELSERMAQQSGLIDVQRFVADQFRSRATALKTRAVLQGLDELMREKPRPGAARMHGRHGADHVGQP